MDPTVKVEPIVSLVRSPRSQSPFGNALPEALLPQEIRRGLFGKKAVNMVLSDI